MSLSTEELEIFASKCDERLNANDLAVVGQNHFLLSWLVEQPGKPLEEPTLENLIEGARGVLRDHHGKTVAEINAFTRAQVEMIDGHVASEFPRQYV